MKFNCIGVKLKNERYDHISLIKKDIDNGKNIKIKPIKKIDLN